MKQLVPFTKNINFETNVDEVISISLDKKISKIEEGNIEGFFDLYLEYKETDVSVDTKKYTDTIPFDIAIDTKYKIDSVNVDIDDFYYDINDNEVILNIILLIDGLEYSERTLEEEIMKHKEKIENNNLEEPLVNIVPKVEEERTDDLFEETDEIKKEIKVPIYQTFDPITENYVTYNVHIVREDDNVESICTKYGVNREDLSYYNDLTVLKIGDKIIVPTYKK